ncbi:MAG: RNA-binding cell elongation regulator Jag/EloR [Pseudomonadota bacterium]
MPVIEFEGKTTEEAIEKACSHLHITPDELKFEIVSAGSTGIFGLGGKKARIIVTVEEKITSNPPSEARLPGGASEPEPEPETRPDRQRPRPKKSRPDRGRPAPPSARPQVEEYFAQEEEAPVFEGATVLPPTVPEPGEELYEGPEDEVMTKVRETLQGILNHMDISAQVTVKKISDRLILNVDGDSSGLLIGKKGVTLDALQFLVNKIINRNRTDKYRIIVDTQNYRERRHQSLIDLANRMASKAQRNKRPVTISQLSAHDRRVVHLTLQEKPGLTTKSRGEGPLKNVVIIPSVRKGAFKFRKPAAAEEAAPDAAETADSVDPAAEGARD